MRRYLPFLDLFMLAILLWTFACGQDAPYRSLLDGNRPIELVLTDKLRQFAGQAGTPPGVRLDMINRALPMVSTIWNPEAVGNVQTVPVDWDDDPAGICAQYDFSLWSDPPHAIGIHVCPAWIFCVTETESTDLYGFPGCFLSLLHELGHNLGAWNPTTLGHAPQNGRPLHGSGPVMCAWESDCKDPALTDYTAEDVALICGNGGHGGRCP